MIQKGRVLALESITGKRSSDPPAGVGELHDWYDQSSRSCAERSEFVVLLDLLADGEQGGVALRFRQAVKRLLRVIR